VRGILSWLAPLTFLVAGLLSPCLAEDPHGLLAVQANIQSSPNGIPSGSEEAHPAADNSAAVVTSDRQDEHRAPILGADLLFQVWPHVLIEGWRDKEKGMAMVQAFKSAGLRSLRFGFLGYYSPVGPEATARVKAENKIENDYPWFPFGLYADFVAAEDFTTVVAVNVEEGPDVAAGVVNEFIKRGISSKLVAIELSNEPHLNNRPWLPEEYASRAAAIIERLTPLGVRLALPLTVGRERHTPTRLSDDEWNGRMLKALSASVDLKNRYDIYGVMHLYSRGVGAGVSKVFSQQAKLFVPHMRYLVTEFNIRSSLKGNPHLTNRYGMELARRLAGLMADPDIEAMYIHAVPYHSILYWSDGKQTATVIDHSDPKLSGEDMSAGWHLTPAGRVYQLYSTLAWNGRVVDFHGGDKQEYWAVRSDAGTIVVTLLNDSDSQVEKEIKLAGVNLKISAPARSIVCWDQNGRELARLVLL
jgi:hypothetical protein